MPSHTEIGDFIWRIANHLRGDYEKNDNEDVILPFTLLRRIDCVLEKTREKVRETEKQVTGKVTDDVLKKLLVGSAGVPFYTAVIHHAVTKGLDPHAKMKPSGVEWLGDVPESWHVHRLRRTTSKEVNGFWGEDPVDQDDIDNIVCLRVADFDRPRRRISDGERTVRRILPSKRRNRILKSGDLLLEKSGGGEQSPVGCVVLFEGDTLAVTSNFVAKLTVRMGYDPRFLCYVHQVLYDERVTMVSVKQTTGIQNLDTFSYLNEKAAFPGYDDQVSIVAHIEHETAKLDTLITKYRRELELLAEYRASLISHAVTGKIDVRGIVSSEGATEAA